MGGFAGGETSGKKVRHTRLYLWFWGLWSEQTVPKRGESQTETITLQNQRNESTLAHLEKEDRFFVRLKRGSNYRGGGMHQGVCEKFLSLPSRHCLSRNVELEGEKEGSSLSKKT